ncbi:MAG TPA: 2-keto-3-deoxy-D-arabinonate dehydratase [Solibacterales bacterium]|nr:2-keto-3-deoxy-D-arabinonate dehydratase [Bryobacterales bacterium]
MQLGQIKKEGATIAAVFEAAGARAIPGHSMGDLIRRSEAENMPLAELANRLASRHHEPAAPVIPIHPAEVWACGCTYQMSSDFRDAEHGTREGMYSYVYRADRPEIFFKGTARVCVGPGQPIGLRRDSKFMAPEPELGVVLGSRGAILGYTLANDVSAWDIERENALYLPQSKTFNGCVALGPVILTADSVANPYALEMTCEIVREGKTIFSGSVSTERLNRKFETLVDYLYRSNSVPVASVVLTGTGIIVKEEHALLPGDEVKIRIPEFGELVNRAAIV